MKFFNAGGVIKSDRIDYLFIYFFLEVVLRMKIQNYQFFDK